MLLGRFLPKTPINFDVNQGCVRVHRLFVRENSPYFLSISVCRLLLGVLVSQHAHLPCLLHQQLHEWFALVLYAVVEHGVF